MGLAALRFLKSVILVVVGVHGLSPAAYTPLPLGTVAPQGWLREQLILQANALSGVLSTSTFPGADTVNHSLWTGGDGVSRSGGGSTQWLPYWTNGNVPLVELLRAAGQEATGRLDSSIDLPRIVDDMMVYVLSHTNTTNGWIGPYLNEPGDTNGHGLWDPLNMLRSLFNWAQAHPERDRDVARAAVAHLTHEAELVETDPIVKWASTRWPTFVELCQYVIDVYVPKYGNDASTMPLGKEGTTALLLDASVTFRARGMNWSAYYHQVGPVRFPELDVQGWNTNDHGVNNAEGALRWPAVSYRMHDDETARDEMDFVLSMLDRFQGQVQSLFCADEVFCGRAPHRGTETCAIVEAMASLEYAYSVFGDGAQQLMDRVERLAFNALPAALTSDMWTHVYVQQANSVFAGNTAPVREPRAGDYIDPSRRHHTLHHQHQHQQLRDAPSCTANHGTNKNCVASERHRHGSTSRLGDTPSGEDQTANFYGVSHFPCCITNFPQGWPKFAHSVYLLNNATAPATLLVASLVPSKAEFVAVGGLNVSVETAGSYPFGDTVTVKMGVTMGVGSGAGVLLKIRIPSWAINATVNDAAVANGTTWSVLVHESAHIVVELNPAARAEFGWGLTGVLAGDVVPYTASRSGATVPSGTPSRDMALSGGAQLLPSRDAGFQDIRSGNPGSNSTVAILHPIGGTSPQGSGHFISGASVSICYVAGYTPTEGTPKKKASQVQLLLVDASHTETVLHTLYTSPGLDAFSYDEYTGYSPPVTLQVDGLRIPDAPNRLLLVVRVLNNERNLQIRLDAIGGLNATVYWTSDGASFPAGPYVPPSPYLEPPQNAVAIARGALVFALHPREQKRVVTTYPESLPRRPLAVDYEISTEDTWNYAIRAAPLRDDWFTFVDAASEAWSISRPFSEQEHPFYIEVRARVLDSWGFWQGSNITANVPPSPVAEDKLSGAEVTLRLVPFGGTNIRVAVLPWFLYTSAESGVAAR